MKKTISVSNGAATLDTNRRNFLKLSGVGLAIAGLALVGCDDDDLIIDPGANVFDLGTGDVGVLNYAYALEQLEADFYTKVVNSFYTGISENEKQIFTGEIVNILDKHSQKGKRYTLVTVRDESGYAEIYLFSQQKFQVRNLKNGMRKQSRIRRLCPLFEYSDRQVLSVSP